MAKETKKVTKKEEKPVDKKVTKKEEESKKKQVETKKKQDAKKKQESSEEESSEESEEESSEEEKEEKESSEEESSEEEKEEKEESSEEESSDEEKEEKDEEEEDEEEEDEEEEEEKVGQKRKQSEDGEQPSKKQAVGSSKVFVGSLSFTTTDDSLKKAFSKYGKVTFSKVSMNDQGRSKGFGFVEFDKEESAQKALEMNGADLDGRQIKVEISQGSRDTSAKGGNRGSTGGSGEATKVLFVGNLSFQTSKDSLYAAFEGFEGLQDARVATDKESGRPRGFGYLEFADAANAKEAYEQMNGADVDGRNIRLDYAAERTGDAPRGGDRGDRGGFRGGFRGGRGGDRGGFRGGRGGERGGFRGGRGGDRGGFRGGRGGDRGGFRGGRGGGSGYEGRKTTFDD